MRGPVRRALRSVAAVLGGYAVIVAGASLAFVPLLGWLGSYMSCGTALAIASVAAFVVGFCGGFVSAWVGGRPRLSHAAGLLIPLAIDTTFVVPSGVSSDPLWYDLAGSLTLVVAALLGGYACELIARRRIALPAA